MFRSLELIEIVERLLWNLGALAQDSEPHLLLNVFYFTICSVLAVQSSKNNALFIMWKKAFELVVDDVTRA